MMATWENKNKNFPPLSCRLSADFFFFFFFFNSMEEEASSHGGRARVPAIPITAPLRLPGQVD